MRIDLRPLFISAGLLLWCAASSAQPVATPRRFQIYAAGSLQAPIDALLAGSGAAPGGGTRPVYGPSGLLRQKLLHGAAVDLFASSVSHCCL